jgi:mono/diheme cytochrome c family protein
MKILGRLFVGGLVTFALMQLVRPGIPSKPATAEVQAPPDVKRILEKDCYNCHSDQRRLSWFDQIVPGYWLVRHDILTAREHLDFSTLGARPPAAQKATLYEAVNMIQLGAMPLPAFVKLHPEAKVTPEDLATLKAYLSPWTPALTYSISLPESNDAKTSGVPASVSLASVQQEFNGFPFDPDFENWKLISTTDRGDNNTFRFILGNDIAIKAAQSGNISLAGWNAVRQDCLAAATRPRRSGAPRQVRTSRVDAEGRSSLQEHRRLGMGPLARPGPEALRRGRAFRERMHWLPPTGAR